MYTVEGRLAYARAAYGSRFGQERGRCEEERWQLSLCRSGAVQVAQVSRCEWMVVEGRNSRATRQQQRYVVKGRGDPVGLSWWTLLGGTLVSSRLVVVEGNS
jgi:hypothetical protein